MVIIEPQCSLREIRIILRRQQITTGSFLRFCNILKHFYLKILNIVKKAKVNSNFIQIMEGKRFDNILKH